MMCSLSLLLLLLPSIAAIQYDPAYVMASSWSMWSPWSFCSNDVMIRVRACSTVRGFKCIGHNKEFQSCNSGLRPVHTAEGIDYDHPDTDDREAAMRQLYQDYDPPAHEEKKGPVPHATRQPRPTPPTERPSIEQFARRYQAPGTEDLIIAPPGSRLAPPGSRLAIKDDITTTKAPVAREQFQIENQNRFTIPKNGGNTAEKTEKTESVTFAGKFDQEVKPQRIEETLPEVIVPTTTQKPTTTTQEQTEENPQPKKYYKASYVTKAPTVQPPTTTEIIEPVLVDDDQPTIIEPQLETRKPERTTGTTSSKPTTALPLSQKSEESLFAYDDEPSQPPAGHTPLDEMFSVDGGNTIERTENNHNDVIEKEISGSDVTTRIFEKQSTWQTAKSKEILEKTRDQGEFQKNTEPSEAVDAAFSFSFPIQKEPETTTEQTTTQQSTTTTKTTTDAPPTTTSTMNEATVKEEMGKSSRARRLKKINRRARVRTISVVATESKKDSSSHVWMPPSENVQMPISSSQNPHSGELAADLSFLPSAERAMMEETKKLEDRVKELQKKVDRVRTTSTTTSEPVQQDEDMLVGDTARALSWLLANMTSLIDKGQSLPVVDMIPLERIEEKNNSKKQAAPAGAELIQEGSEPLLIKEDKGTDPIVRVEPKQVFPKKTEIRRSPRKHKWSDWSLWSECNCGKQTRKRICIRRVKKHRHDEIARVRRALACPPAQYQSKQCESKECRH